jgi:NAD(P)-dependent dehydrogenase (short-subunit alcohol dehydrogenase family)
VGQRENTEDATRPARAEWPDGSGLDGRVYLVTGSSRGLGFAAAQALVADGVRVMLSAPHEALQPPPPGAVLAPAECACVLREHLRFGHLAVMSGSRA